MKDTTNSHILIVDDDTALLDRYVENLSGAYQIVTAKSSRVAIERMKRNSKIDLAVIEYRLPDMTGIEAMREIKDVAPSVPVIIVTAYGDEDVAVEAFRSGARDYLRKPFSISELSTKINFYLALRHKDKHRRKNILLTADTPTEPGAPPPAVSLSQNHKIQQAVRFINTNFRTNFRLDDAARKAGISPAPLFSNFQESDGHVLSELPFQSKNHESQEPSPHQHQEHNRNRPRPRFCRPNRVRQIF